MSDPDQKTPPKGDSEKAEKYINQLVELINQSKLQVFRTDLKKFDPGSLQDHYTINLTEYQIEISHSKQPNSGKTSYVMIFNNFKHLAQGNGEKVILAYIYLADAQYSKFKIVADRQIEERRRLEEEKRFKEALVPIDNLLNQVSSTSPAQNPQTSTTAEESTNNPSYISELQIHQI